MAPVTWTRSDPARSTRFSLPTLTGWDGLSPPGRGGLMLPAHTTSFRQLTVTGYLLCAAADIETQHRLVASCWWHRLEYRPRKI